MDFQSVCFIKLFQLFHIYMSIILVILQTYVSNTKSNLIFGTSLE